MFLLWKIQMCRRLQLFLTKNKMSLLKVLRCKK